MRLRRKPWVDEAIHDFDDFVFPKDRPAGEQQKGNWHQVFGREARLYVELGTGRYTEGGRPTPWVYQDDEGNWHWTAGNPAQPFLKPAVADHAQTYRNIIEDEIKNG